MSTKKWIIAGLSFIGAAVAIAAAVYGILNFLDRKKATSACIECDCGTEFDLENA